MKKILIALTALLLCLFSVPALADDAWAVYAGTDAGGYLLGTAVPCGDGMLLSVEGAAVDGMPLYAVRREQTVQISYAVGFDSGALVLFADGVTGELSQSDADIGETVYCAAANEAGVISAPGELSTLVRWHGFDCPLLTCTASLTIGAPVNDADGLLVGLVSAVWGEGENRYVVLPIAAMADAPALAASGSYGDSAVIYDNAPDTMQKPIAPAESSERWVSGFTAHADGTQITVDWSAAGHVPGEGESYYVLFMDAANPYFSYLEVQEGVTDVSFYAPPERTYAIWVQCCTEEAFSSDMSMSAFEVVDTGEASAFTGYEYTDRELYVGEIPADSEPNAVKAEPLDRITVKDIINPDTLIVLQAVTSYEIAEEMTVSMQTVLTTPDGYALMQDSSFIFIPDIAHEDVWNVELDSLFGLCEQFAGFISTGEYEVAYYFEGQLVNKLTFTVE